MLTIAAVKAAGAQARAYKLFDGGGLFLHVAPTGGKSWRLKYRFGGREKLLTVGRFPEVSLPEARARREEAKAVLRDGRDPAHAGGAPETFEQLARAWHAHQVPRWSTTHAADVLASLERDVFPAIGKRPIGEIGAAELLHAIGSVERRGRRETARRIRQRCSAIFGYAISQGLVSQDPAAMLGRAMMAPALAQPHAALTSIDACRALIDACNRVAGASSAAALASRFLALTAVRLDAVRGMRWDEVEDLDGAAPLWRVPPARMKLARAKKESDRFAHLVPLSAPAVAALRAAAEIGYDTPSSNGLVFPGAGKTRPLGEGALRQLYARAGFAGRHVPHGWRASFSTILNELHPEDRAAIDAALGHAGKGKVEAAYNRAQLLEQRRRLFDRWGALLTA